MTKKGREAETRAMKRENQISMATILNKGQERDPKIETKRSIGTRRMIEKIGIRTTTEDLGIAMMATSKEREMTEIKIGVKMIAIDEEATATRGGVEIEIEVIGEIEEIEGIEEIEEIKELKKIPIFKRENKLKESGPLTQRRLTNLKKSWTKELSWTRKRRSLKELNKNSNKLRNKSKKPREKIIQLLSIVYL